MAGGCGSRARRGGGRPSPSACRSWRGGTMVVATSAVLVVDDEPDLLEIVATVLADEGYRVLTARDGLEALQALTRELPGLILLDMKMPRMNGWEFAREFRAQYDDQIPIVVLTAAQDAQRRASEIGA